MVIYLQTKIRLIIIILIIIVVYGLSYYLSYLRYNDYDNVKLNMLEIENKDLKKELNDIKESLNITPNDDNYLITKVINRDIYSFYNEITINGGKDYILEGSPVISSEGLIGIVSKVENNKSIVKLLTGNYNISVKINDTYGNLNKGEITLLDKYATINIGDKVYTSGLTNIKEGIYIGDIKEISLNHDNTSQIAKINLLDNKNLNYVAVARLQWSI